MAFINKMDIMGANFYNSVQMMKDRLKCNAVPLMIPMGAEDQYVGEIDLIKMVAITYDKNDIHKLIEGPIPAEYADKAEEIAYEYD